MKNKIPGEVDQYINSFPQATQQVLNLIRATIHKTVPGVEENISYTIIGFMHHKKYVIHLGAFKNHIGLYPVPKGNDDFKKRIAPYQSGKSTIRFSLDQVIPLPLITRIVRLRISQNEKKIKSNSEK